MLPLARIRTITATLTRTTTARKSMATLMNSWSTQASHERDARADKRRAFRLVPRRIPHISARNHELIPSPSRTGKFTERDMPNYSGRNWTERGFTIGIGG